MALARKIAYNALVSAISKILSTALALVSIGFITRYLGADGFGQYATVLAFFAFFVSLGDLGLYSIATREISRDGADAGKIFSAVFMLRIITAIVVVLFAPILILFLPYSADVEAGILLIAITFAFASSYSLFNGIFQKHLAMDRVAITELLGKIIQTGIIIFVVQVDAGFVAIILSLLCAMLFNFIVLFFLARRYITFVPRVDVAYWKKFLRLSLPMGVATFITFLYIKTDTIILSLMRTEQEVGIYGAAYKIVDSLAFFPAMIIGLTLPLLSRYIFTDKALFTTIAHKTVKLFIIIVVPLIVGTLFMADFIMEVIGGAAFVDSAIVLRILIFASALIFFGHFFNNILIAGNRQKELMLALIVVALFNIIANVTLIPRFSYLASAYISVITEMLVVGIGAALCMRYIKYTPEMPFFGRTLFAAGVMALCFFLLMPTLHILLVALIASLIYSALLWAMHVVSREELVSIMSRK